MRSRLFFWSSTTNMHHGPLPGSRPTTRLVFLPSSFTADLSTSIIGTAKRKHEPLPTSLRTVSVPCINSTRRRLTASPRPVPPLSPFDLSCQKASKMRPKSSPLIPTPVSSTSTTSMKLRLSLWRLPSTWSARTRTATPPTLSVNRMALLMRFIMTCPILPWSASAKRGTSSAHSKSRWIPLASARGRNMRSRSPSRSCKQKLTG